MDVRNQMHGGVFYYKAHTKSHKQWLEQADGTKAQAPVWCPVKKQMQPRLISMPLVPAAPQLARKTEAKPVSAFLLLPAPVTMTAAALQPGLHPSEANVLICLTKPNSV